MDTNAQALFPQITNDMKLAIANLVPQSDDASDPIIHVDIRKIALNGDTILPESAEFNELEGVVSSKPFRNSKRRKRQSWSTA